MISITVNFLNSVEHRGGTSESTDSFAYTRFKEGRYDHRHRRFPRIEANLEERQKKSERIGIVLGVPTNLGMPTNCLGGRDAFVALQ